MALGRFCKLRSVSQLQLRGLRPWLRPSPKYPRWQALGHSASGWFQSHQNQPRPQLARLLVEDNDLWDDVSCVFRVGLLVGACESASAARSMWGHPSRNEAFSESHAGLRWRLPCFILCQISSLDWAMLASPKDHRDPMQFRLSGQMAS